MTMQFALLSLGYMIPGLLAVFNNEALLSILIPISLLSSQPLGISRIYHWCREIASNSNLDSP